MRVPVHGWIVGSEERAALHALVDREPMWLTAGEQCKLFARKLRDYTGKRGVSLCNSGSSANLLALSALTAVELGDRAIQPGDEVITTALNFPTTLNPILQIGAVPVLVDVDFPGMVPTIDRIAAAVTEQTKAIVLSHTLGYPLPMAELRRLCDKHGLWLIADCCDALGTPGAFDGADFATLSFFPAHQIAAANGGGAVLYDSMFLGKLVNSFRDWGRDCWCLPGHDNTCGVRFAGGEDHKYTYSHIGYHLSMGEFQAAMGAVQMDRLPGFVEARRFNHAKLLELALSAGLDKRFILPPNVNASWFGFALLCIPPIKRDDLTQYLEAHGIQTRRMFGGNLLRQPAYQGEITRVNEPLLNTDIVHDTGFWVGCWPGLSGEQLAYTIDTIVGYVEGL